MFIDWADKFTLIAAAVVAILGVGRLTRVLTSEEFPPAAWVRALWMRITWDRKRDEEGPWTMLVTCWWCASFWIMAACLTWGWATSLHWSWWAFWGCLGASYLAAIIIEHDDRPNRSGD